ncbi:UNVERIFIED_CONTAM: hypothetical protein K2H54_063075 [Gekko kuhli]
MSGEEENIIPTTTGGATPTTQAMVPVTVPVTGIPSTTDTCSTHREAHGTMMGCCTNERNSQFDTGLYEDPSYPQYGATEEATGQMWVTNRTRKRSDQRTWRRTMRLTPMLRLWSGASGRLSGISKK